DAVAAFIAPFIGRHDLEDLRTIFDEHGVCWGPYQSFLQLVEEDPRCSTDNPMFAMVDQPGVGRVLAPRTPLDYHAIDRNPPGPAPKLGQHTDQILLEELGLSEHEIGLLHDKGIVAGAVG
ncbi:MAG: CoA transferase, partial [Acidimicrobiales bacterium]